MLQFSNTNYGSNKPRKSTSDFVSNFAGGRVQQQSKNDFFSNSFSSGTQNSTGGTNNSSSQSTGSFGNYEDYQERMKSGGGGMRTMDMRDSDGDGIDDRDQGGAGQPRFRDNPDYYTGGAVNTSGGNDTSVTGAGGSEDKFAKAREAANKYKTYMDDGSGTGWGSSEFQGSHQHIGPNELAAMERESGLSTQEINDFFQSSEGQTYFNRKHRTGGRGSKHFNNMTAALAERAAKAAQAASSTTGPEAAEKYKNDFIADGFDASSNSSFTDNTSNNTTTTDNSVNDSNNRIMEDSNNETTKDSYNTSTETTTDNSVNDSYNQEDFDKQNDNTGVIGDGTQANNNTGVVGDGTQMNDNQGQIGDYNQKDSNNTDYQADATGEAQGGVGNFNLRSPFDVGGDLMSQIGDSGDTDLNLSGATFGDFANINSDYSVRIGTIGNGNNMGGGSGSSGGSDGVYNGMDFMQFAAGFAGLNNNQLAQSQSQMSGLSRPMMSAGLVDSATGTKDFARGAYNMAGESANAWKMQSEQTTAKTYGNTDFSVTGWYPFQSPKKTEDKTEDIAKSF